MHVLKAGLKGDARLVAEKTAGFFQARTAALGIVGQVFGVVALTVFDAQGAAGDPG